MQYSAVQCRAKNKILCSAVQSRVHSKSQSSAVLLVRAERSAKAQSVRQGVKGERELVSAIVVGSGERWLIWICHTAAIERFVYLLYFWSEIHITQVTPPQLSSLR